MVQATAPSGRVDKRSPKQLRSRPLDHYKLLPIIRSDVVEDPEPAVEDIALGAAPVADAAGTVADGSSLPAAGAAALPLKRGGHRKKGSTPRPVNTGAPRTHPPRERVINLPAPPVHEVATYEEDVSADFAQPNAYIRPRIERPDDVPKEREYEVDRNDEEWLSAHPKYGPSGDPRYRLDLDVLERMLDVLEKATRRDAPISQGAAEDIFIQEFGMYAGSGNKVVKDVYEYWIAKRTRLKKPLLRRFWPVTSITDTSPHLTFRPREKERYKLRRKRGNDLEGYEKLAQLQRDFHHVHNLMELVRRREKLHQLELGLLQDHFEHSLWEMTRVPGAEERRLLYPREETEVLGKIRVVAPKQRELTVDLSEVDAVVAGGPFHDSPIWKYAPGSAPGSSAQGAVHDDAEDGGEAERSKDRDRKRKGRRRADGESEDDANDGDDGDYDPRRPSGRNRSRGGRRRTGSSSAAAHADNLVGGASPKRYPAERIPVVPLYLQSLGGAPVYSSEFRGIESEGPVLATYPPHRPPLDLAAEDEFWGDGASVARTIPSFPCLRASGALRRMQPPNTAQVTAVSDPKTHNLGPPTGALGGKRSSATQEPAELGHEMHGGVRPKYRCRGRVGRGGRLIIDRIRLGDVGGSRRWRAIENQDLYGGTHPVDAGQDFLDFSRPMSDAVPGNPDWATDAFVPTPASRERLLKLCLMDDSEDEDVSDARRAEQDGEELVAMEISDEPPPPFPKSKVPPPSRPRGRGPIRFRFIV